ncbi:MAG: KpsF/GutQ family sugar-phosphate isomerase [Saprospiraceae bacterium]|nr:KpsF/GutQ family sugar-phosphate isomerase [Saprospiraceae bacterium]
MEAQILNSLTTTLEIETATLAALTQSIGKSHVEAVEMLFACKGKIVVTGVGKSAIIGQKLVATLNSTGSKSVFMHAADAVHGDLGQIDKDDLVICLSKSGETAELKVLLPILKSMGNLTIAMVSNEASFLASQSDLCLMLPVEKEADPNNLAPTASTIAQLAMGDALAMALLNLRGFSSKDFALLHPGGNLGKMLYTTVADLAYKNASPKVTPSALIKDIIITMTSGRLGATAVIDDHNQILGIITDGDLRRMLMNQNFQDNITAAHIMTQTPKTIEKTALAAKAMEQMRAQSISQLLVTDDQGYCGIIHMHDLIKEGFV